MKKMVFRQSTCIHTEQAAADGCHAALRLGMRSTALQNQRSNKLQEVTLTTARTTEREDYLCDNNGKYQEVPQ
jgi:hypothetical protein